MDESTVLVRPTTTRIVVPPLHIPPPEEMIPVAIRKQLGLSTVRGDVHIEGLLTPGAEQRFQIEINNLLHTSNLLVNNPNFAANDNSENTTDPSNQGWNHDTVVPLPSSDATVTESNPTVTANESIVPPSLLSSPTSSVPLPPPVIIRHTLPPANVRMPASAQTVTKVILSDGRTITGPEAEKIAREYEHLSPHSSATSTNSTNITAPQHATTSLPTTDSASTSDTNNALNPSPQPRAGRRKSISFTATDTASVAIDAKKIALQRKSRRGSVTAPDIVYSVDAPAWYTDTTTTGKMVRKMNLHPFLGIDVNVRKLESEWVTDKKGIVRRRSSVQRELMQELAASSSSSSSVSSTVPTVPSSTNTLDRSRSSSVSEIPKRDRSKSRNEHINPHVSVLASTAIQEGENIAELEAKLEMESHLLVQELQKARSRSSSSVTTSGNVATHHPHPLEGKHPSHNSNHDTFWWDNLLRQPPLTNAAVNNTAFDTKENENRNDFPHEETMDFAFPASSNHPGNDNLRYVTSIPEDQQSADEHSGNEDEDHRSNGSLLPRTSTYSPVPGSAFSRPTSRGAASRPLSRGILAINNNNTNNTGTSPNSRPGSQSVGIRSPSNRDIIVYGFTTNMMHNDRSPNRGNSNNTSRPSTHHGGLGSRSGVRHSPNMMVGTGLSQQDISNKLTELSLASGSMETTGTLPGSNGEGTLASVSFRSSRSTLENVSLPTFPTQSPDVVLQSSSSFFSNQSKDEDDDMDNNKSSINNPNQPNNPPMIPEKYLFHASVTGSSTSSSLSISPPTRNNPTRSTSRPRSYVTSSWPDTVSFQRMDNDNKHRPLTKQGTNVYQRLYTADVHATRTKNKENGEEHKRSSSNGRTAQGQTTVSRSRSRSASRSPSRSGIPQTNSSNGNQQGASTDVPVRNTRVSPKPEHSPYADKEVLLDTLPKQSVSTKDKSRSPSTHRKPFTTGGPVIKMEGNGNKRSSSSSSTVRQFSGPPKTVARSDGHPSFPAPVTMGRTHKDTIPSSVTEGSTTNSVVSLPSQGTERNNNTLDPNSTTLPSAVRFSPVPLGSSLSSTPLLPSATSSIIDINGTLPDGSTASTGSLPHRTDGSTASTGSLPHRTPTNSNPSATPFAIGNLSVPVSVHASALSSPVNSTVLTFDPSSNNFRALGGAASITGTGTNPLVSLMHHPPGGGGGGRNSVLSLGPNGGYNSNFLLSTLPTPTGLSSLQFNTEGLLLTSPTSSNAMINTARDPASSSSTQPPLTAIGLSNLSAAFQARLAEFSRSLMNTPATLASPSMVPQTLNSTSGNPPSINFNAYPNYPPSHSSYHASSTTSLPLTGRGSVPVAATPVSFSLATYTPNKASSNASVTDTTSTSVPKTAENETNRNPSENASFNASVTLSTPLNADPNGTPIIPPPNRSTTVTSPPSSTNGIAGLSVNTNIQPPINLRHGSRESPVSLLSPASTTSSVILQNSTTNNMETITAMASATVLDSFKNIADKYLGSRSHSSLGTTSTGTTNNTNMITTSFTNSGSSSSTPVPPPSSSSSSSSSSIVGGIPVPPLIINRLPSPSVENDVRSTTSSYHSRSVSLTTKPYNETTTNNGTNSPSSPNSNGTRLRRASGNATNDYVSPSTVRAYSRSGIRSRSRSSNGNSGTTPLTPPRSIVSNNSSAHSLTPSRSGIMSRQQASRLGSRTGIGALAAGSVIEYTQSLIDAVPPLSSPLSMNKANVSPSAAEKLSAQPATTFHSHAGQGNTYSTLLPESNVVISPRSIYSSKNTSPYAIHMQAYQTEYSSHNVPPPYMMNTLSMLTTDTTFNPPPSFPVSPMGNYTGSSSTSPSINRGGFRNNPNGNGTIHLPSSPEGNPMVTMNDDNTIDPEATSPNKPRWIGPRGKVVVTKSTPKSTKPTFSPPATVTNTSATKSSASSIKSTHSPFLTYRQMHGTKTTLESLLTRSIQDVTEFYIRAEELVMEAEKAKYIQDRTMTEAQKKSRQNSLVASSSRPAQIITPNRSNNPSPNPNKSRAASPSLGTTLGSIQEMEDTVGFSNAVTNRLSEHTMKDSTWIPLTVPENQPTNGEGELPTFRSSDFNGNEEDDDTYTNVNPVIPVPKASLAFTTPVKNSNTYTTNNNPNTNIWDPFGNAFSTPTPRTATQDLLPSVTIGRRIISSNNPVIQNGGGSAMDFDLQQASFLAEQLLYAPDEEMHAVQNSKNKDEVGTTKKAIVPKSKTSTQTGMNNKRTGKESTSSSITAVERTPNTSGKVVVMSTPANKISPQRTVSTVRSKSRTPGGTKGNSLSSVPSHTIVENIATVPSGTVAPVSKNLMILHTNVNRTAVQQEADELAKKANQLLHWTENYDKHSTNANRSDGTANEEQEVVPKDESYSVLTKEMNGSTSDVSVMANEEVPNTGNETDILPTDHVSSLPSVDTLNTRATENVNNIRMQTYARNDQNSSTIDSAAIMVKESSPVGTDKRTTSVPSSASPDRTNHPSTVPVTASLFVSPSLIHSSSSPTLIRPHSQGFPVTSSRLLSQSLSVINTSDLGTTSTATISPSRSIRENSVTLTNNGNGTTVNGSSTLSDEFLINPFSDALPSSRPSTVPHGYSPRNSSNSNRRTGETSPLRSTHHKASQNVAPYRAPVTNS